MTENKAGRPDAKPQNVRCKWRTDIPPDKIYIDMKIVLTITFLLIFSLTYSQADTSHFIKVHFLYGSKPKRKHKDTEFKAFGGLHGGHSTIQVDDVDYGFEPTTNRVHIFARKKRKSDFVDKQLNGADRYSKESKTVTFIIPITHKQYQDINRIHKSYCDTTPYDYAFFGMRCASTTQDVLGQIGVVKKKRRFGNIVTTFYPKKLRKRLFRLAKKNNYQVIKNAGRQTRKWERD